MRPADTPSNDKVDSLTPRSFDEAAAQTSGTPAIKIDDDVPLPPPTNRGSRNGVAAALRSLAVGQSFVFPSRGAKPIETQTYASRTARSVKDKKFTTRVVEENGERVVRVWRTA